MKHWLHGLHPIHLKLTIMNGTGFLIFYSLHTVLKKFEIEVPYILVLLHIGKWFLIKSVYIKIQCLVFMSRYDHNIVLIQRNLDCFPIMVEVLHYPKRVVIIFNGRQCLLFLNYSTF